MFGGGFKSAKCKTLLRLAMARIKLLRNKRDVQVKQMRKDIAQLLSTGQDPSARIRVEHIAREQDIMAAYDMIELFCELIIVRLPIIESHKVCPIDLKEAVATLIFASPRCSDLPELLQIRSVFSSKYGKEFIAAALELRPECGVNRRVVEKLSVRAPSGETKVKLLTEIAAEHHVTWDPAATLAELLKKPEDLLEGPTKFSEASEMHIPEPRQAPVKTDQSSGSYSQRATVQPQVSPPCRPAPSVSRRPIAKVSSDSDEGDTRSDKKQIGLFSRPMHAKRAASTPKVQSLSTERAASTRSSGKFESSSSTGGPHARGRKDASDENRVDYEHAAAAAKTAAQCADRAVAAARLAANLAKTHPFKGEHQPPSRARSASNDRQSSSSSDEDNNSTTKRTSMTKHELLRHQQQQQQQKQSGKSGSFYVTSDSYYRNGNPHPHWLHQQGFTAATSSMEVSAQMSAFNVGAVDLDGLNVSSPDASHESLSGYPMRSSLSMLQIC